MKWSIVVIVYSGNDSNTASVATVAISITLLLTHALVAVVLLLLRKRWRKEDLVKVENNYDYGVYYD